MNMQLMKPPFRSKQELVINAPLENVWAFNQDLTNIADYHPRISQVDLLSGKSMREAGVSYQCHLDGGKHSCIEKDISIIPMEKIVTVLLETNDRFSRLFSDYTLETVFTPVGEERTRMEFYHYYSTKTIKAKLLNLFAKKALKRCSRATHVAMKEMIEITMEEI
jgi:hypothetical protein